MEERYCETCKRMTDENCKKCTHFEPNKVMVLVDACKNIVPLSADEVNQMFNILGTDKMREILDHRVIRNENLKELDKGIHEFLKHTKEVTNEYRRKR